VIQKVCHAVIRSLGHIPPAYRTHFIILGRPVADLFVSAIEMVDRCKRRMKHVIAMGVCTHSYVLLFAIEVQNRIVWNLTDELAQGEDKPGAYVACGYWVVRLHDV